MLYIAMLSSFDPSCGSTRTYMHKRREKEKDSLGVETRIEGRGGKRNLI